MTCPNCQTTNLESSRACIGCGTSLAAIRAQHYLAQTEAEIQRTQYDRATMSLARADGEIVGIAPQQPELAPLSAQACWLQGRIYYHSGLLAEAGVELAAARQKLVALGREDALLAEVLNLLGNIEYLSGREATAKELYERSSAIAAQSGAHEVGAKVLGNLGNIYMDAGEIEQAISFYQRGLAEAEASGNQSTVALSYRSLALIYAACGPMSRAYELINKALALRVNMSEPGRLLMITCDAGTIYLAAGELVEAEHYLREAYSLCQNYGGKMGMDGVLSIMAELHRLLGQDEQWFAAAHRAFTYPTGTTIWKSEGAFQLARYYVVHGETAQASKYISWLKNALGAGELSDARIPWAEALLASRAGRWAESEAAFAAAAERLQAARHYVKLAMLHRDYAAACIWQGNPNTAATPRVQLTAAADLYRQLGLPLLQAEVEAELARL